MFLVLGNAAIDDSMSTPEWPTPGATVLVGPPSRDLGGKGANQAIILARTGASLRFVATVGDDDAGEWIRRELAAEGLDTNHIVTLPGPSDRSLIFVSPSGENAIASTSHCSDALTPEHAGAAIAQMSQGDVLLTQGGLTAETTAAAFATARAKGMSIVFNPSALRDGFDALAGQADLLVLNHHEATQLTGETSPRSAARSLRSRGTATVVVTLGSQGALALSPDGEMQVPASAVTVVDTTGAGDTFLAVLAAAVLHHHMALEPAMRAAAEAAAITVSRRGTRTAFPTRSELTAILPER
jgi:ribokinase